MHIITVKITVAVVYIVVVNWLSLSNGKCGLSKCELTIDGLEVPPSPPCDSRAIKCAYQFRAAVQISTPHSQQPVVFSENYSPTQHKLSVVSTIDDESSGEHRSRLTRSCSDL